METRTTPTTARLNDYLGGPDVGPVCRPERIVQRAGEGTREVEYAIAGAGPEGAGAADLLDWWRGHRGIEGRVHWVRDVTRGEDARRIRTAAGAEGTAGLRNAAIGRMRLSGATTTAEALRENLDHARDLLTKLGIMNL